MFIAPLLRAGFCNIRAGFCNIRAGFCKKLMTNLDEIIAIEIGDETISLADMLRHAKLNERLQIFDDALAAALIRIECGKCGIEPTEEELQEAADRFRADRELYDEERTEQWLAQHHLSYSDWENLLEADVLKNKLIKSLTDGQIEQHFAENRLSFDSAKLSHLVVKDEEIARELRLQVTEEDADFHALARKYSIDGQTKLAGGFIGDVPRKDMEATVEAAVFGASGSQIAGPFKLSSGWTLFKIEAINRAALDDEMRESIRYLIFDEWLSEAKRKAKPTIPLLEVEEEEEDNDE